MAVRDNAALKMRMQDSKQALQANQASCCRRARGKSGAVRLKITIISRE